MIPPHKAAWHEHWLSDLLCGMLVGTACSYTFIGWALMEYAGLASHWTLLLCAAIGTSLGGILAYENIQERKADNG